ncbi:MAG: DUF4105 domain-containing protein [Gammaproteobacteria bacterium]
MSSNLLGALKKLQLRWKILAALLLPILLLNLYYLTQTPTNDGPWLPQYEQLATIDVTGNEVEIKNFRRARYDQNGQISGLDYSTRRVNLSQLQSIWYGVSVFSDIGLAHTFLSFDFADNDPVVISVEARQRPDQSYDPIAGALDNYHLIYVFADERDIIGVRTHKRNEQVRFMPIEADEPRMQRMFLDMVARANALAVQPEFYNTFTSNCTNNIMQQTDIPAWQSYLDPRILLPGYSDSIAYAYGVLDDNYTLAQIRAAATIRPQHFSDADPEFYRLIRDNYLQAISQTPATSR